MKYSSGDTVKFKLKSGEIQEGRVEFIEKGYHGDMVLVRGFSRWDRVPEKKIISRIPEKSKSVQLKIHRGQAPYKKS